MLSFFECITHSSLLSLEDIKLTAIVNWFLHVSDFSRLFVYILSMVEFYENILQLIVFHLLQYNCYSTNYLIVLVVMIFFFIVKKCLISQIISNCFIFFFQSKKFCYTFNCGATYFYKFFFQSKKISLILHSSVLSSFSSLI